MVVRGRQTPPFAAMYRRKSPQDFPEESALSGPLRTLELAFKEAESRKAEAYRRGILPDHATIIEYGPVRILLSGSPNPDALHLYAKKLAPYNVKHVVRVCEPTYDANELRDLGLRVHEWPFPDGDAPPETILIKWLALLDHIFDIKKHAKTPTRPTELLENIDSDTSPSSSMDTPKQTVAIHCAAGLGRAPVLAAIALVELGLDPFEAVGWIRALRRGAINASQMAFVEMHSRRPRSEPIKRRSSRSRSGSIVGGLLPAWMAACPFRSRSPSQDSLHGSRSSTPRRISNNSLRRTSDS